MNINLIVDNINKIYNRYNIERVIEIGNNNSYYVSSDIASIDDYVFIILPISEMIKENFFQTDLFAVLVLQDKQLAKAYLKEKIGG